MTDKLGTNWVASGEGATAEELRAALLGQCQGIVWQGLVIHLDHLPKEKTCLALTGRPLQDYDFDRILAL